MPTDRPVLPKLLLTVREVAAVVSVSERMIRGMVASGRFPRPLRIGRSVRWRASDVATWVDRLTGADGRR